MEKNDEVEAEFLKILNNVLEWGFPPEGYSILESIIIDIGIAIVIGPNLQKFIGLIIRDIIP
jgi:hypothetical protein